MVPAKLLIAYLQVIASALYAYKVRYQQTKCNLTQQCVRLVETEISDHQRLTFLTYIVFAVFGTLACLLCECRCLCVGFDTVLAVIGLQLWLSFWHVESIPV